MTQTLHVIPAATVTHTIAVIYGDIISDITVHHALTSDARIGLTFGTTLMNLYSASAAQGLLEAFAALRTRHVDVVLTIVGDGPERAALERQFAGFVQAAPAAA